MRKLLLLTSISAFIFCSTNLFSQNIFLDEAFDGEGSETADTWLPEGWTSVDSDGDEFNWYWGYRDSDENGSMRSESWDSEGEQALTPDNWLITPAIDLSEVTSAVELSFKVAPTANTSAYRKEHYSVWISTTDTELESFSMIYEETLSESDENWVYVEKNVDLSEYAGENVYIAFRHHESTDNDRITLDDVTVSAVSTGNPTNPLSNVNVYPNPFNNEIFISNIEKISHVVITNLIGQIVVDCKLVTNRINTSNLNKGIYLMVLQTKNGESKVRKVVKQ